MSVDSCMKYVKELLEFDRRMLILKIGEIANKHNNNEKLTDKERFVIGLRYSEFLALEDSDSGYYQAEMKRLVCLEKLGLDAKWVYEQCILLCSLY